MQSVGRWPLKCQKMHPFGLKSWSFLSENLAPQPFFSRTPNLYFIPLPLIAFPLSHFYILYSVYHIFAIGILYLILSLNILFVSSIRTAFLLHYFDTIESASSVKQHFHWSLLSYISFHSAGLCKQSTNITQHCSVGVQWSSVVQLCSVGVQCRRCLFSALQLPLVAHCV